jgi:hypothetical protein
MKRDFERFVAFIFGGDDTPFWFWMACMEDVDRGIDRDRDHRTGSLGHLLESQWRRRWIKYRGMYITTRPFQLHSLSFSEIVVEESDVRFLLAAGRRSRC